MKRSKRKAKPPDPAQFAPKATGDDLTLHSRTIGVLPILNKFITRCRLDELLVEYLPKEDRRNRISTRTAILLLVRNVLTSREPVYGIGQWAAQFIPEMLDLREDQLGSLNDDRVGRALDRLFDVNFPDFVMAVTRRAVQEFDIDLSELHNDSTTVKFNGRVDRGRAEKQPLPKPVVESSASNPWFVDP